MRLRVYVATAREALGMVEDLAELAMVEVRDEIRARVNYMIALSVAALLGVFALLFAGLLVLVLAWETPYRVPAAICLAVVPLVAAVAIGVLVAKRWRNDQWLSATRNETKELYAWLKSKL